MITVLNNRAGSREFGGDVYQSNKPVKHTEGRPPMAKNFVVLTTVGISLLIGGCGRFRGISTHGGGKRFYIEQELVAATARATAKDIDVTPLKGKLCALYVVSMGDEGAGNIMGGRYSIDTLIRGAYQQSPTQTTTSRYPVYDSTATVRDSAGDVTQTTTATGNMLNAPQKSTTRTTGLSDNYGIGAQLSWPGTYRAEAFINPRDSQFLNAVIHEALALQGVLIVAPEQADVDVYVTVDAFGTCHDRFEYLVVNKEVLTAKTALSICAFDRRNGGVILAPTTSAFEAEYCEEFVFWCGPLKETKLVRRAGNLLVDFKDVPIDGGKPGELPDVKRGATDVEGEVPRTRPKELTQPLPKPDPSRPEDLPPK